MTKIDVFYNIVINLGLPVVIVLTLFGFWRRSLFKALKYKFFSPPDELLPENVRFWLHGASMGEQVLIKRVAGWLEELGVDPEEIAVSAQTFSGFESIEYEKPVFMPHDYSWLIKNICRRLNPEHLLIMETEIWPNLYRYNSGKVSILNARMKSESYNYYRKFAKIVNTALGHCRTIIARTENDGQRFQEFCPENVEIIRAGSLKWLSLLEEVQIPEKPKFTAARPVLVAGSTQPGEEQKILNLVDEKNCSAYIVPRHLERIDDVKKLLNERGLSWQLFSQLETNYEGQVILIDSMGVLAGVYGLADVAFVGGTWNSSIGGHNLLEPLACSVPVITGPYLHNVRETADELQEYGLLFSASAEDEWPDMFDKALQAKQFTAGLEKLKLKARKIKNDYYSFLKELVNEKKDGKI